MQNIAVSCHDDIDKYCGATEIKPGSLRACVNQFKNNFKLQCQNDINEHAEKRNKEKKATPPVTITIEMDGDSDEQDETKKSKEVTEDLFTSSKKKNENNKTKSK